MGLFGKKNEKLLMYHCEGLPLRNDCPINLELDTGTRELIITEFPSKKHVLTLPISRISRTGVLKVEEIERGNMIGRAIVGGVLYGGAGAIIGALSAQDRQKTKYLYSINYDEDKAVVMRSAGAINEMKFRRALDELL